MVLAHNLPPRIVFQFTLVILQLWFSFTKLLYWNSFLAKSFLTLLTEVAAQLFIFFHSLLILPKFGRFYFCIEMRDFAVVSIFIFVVFSFYRWVSIFCFQLHPKISALYALLFEVSLVIHQWCAEYFYYLQIVFLTSLNFL